MMLVFSDGSQCGTLGGGCVEAEVKRRALQSLSAKEATVSRFQLDSDYGWDDGLICGGRMQVLIVPLGGTEADDYFRRMTELAAQGAGFTEAVLFDGEASQCAAPALYLFDQDDRPIAGVCLAPVAMEREEDSTTVAADSATPPCPAIVAELLRPLSARSRPYATQGIAFLPAQPRCRLIIVGGGHVGQAVANLAADLDFDVWVVDDRREYVSELRFPRAQRRIAGDMDTVLPGVEITSDTYCLIVTRGHSHDEEALYHLVNRGARYVGLIGSRRKIKMIFEDLLAEGIPAEALARVYAPLGIDIGSQTVPEIAVSICAELVSHRNRDGVVPGRPDPVRVTDEVLP
jgi:xanthine dehydrogenase accessory factor